MTAFLTSSPTGPLDGSRPCDGLDPLNGFPQLLRMRIPAPVRGLIVSAFPDDRAANDEMRAFFEGALIRSGIPLLSLDLLDRRAAAAVPDLSAYGLILLGGGHVPTENAFFAETGLRGRLSGWRGGLVGIAAGSMNAADCVYAQPEEPGESLDPAYRRFLPGLCVTKTQILPHYQMAKDRLLDGRRLMEDITYPDSRGRAFLALPDGSFLLCENGRETVYGEAYRIEDGVCRLFCREGESRLLRG